jgi:hypothetical protein
MTTGGEEKCGGSHWKSGSSLSGAGTLEIELLSQRPIEPGEPTHSQGSAGAKREAFSLRLSAHHGAATTGRLRGQWERVARIRREEGIKVSKKQRRMKRLGISTAERQRAKRPGQVWSWDFVADQTENGSSFRISLYWTNTRGNAWPFILRGRSGPSMSSRLWKRP